jgi:Subtilase family/Abnormal spindle-like microcephaly-assoc'd, ASPM-SPD-2-Hydin
MMRYGFLVAAALAALAVTIDAQQPDVTAANSKLTTVLADLVRSSNNSTTLTTESQRPSSVQNAMRTRRLRIDANNEVQVYILMSAVTDDSVRQLTDAGVTIEIRDAARRRVQAHLPVSRLTAVAQLAFVDAIRLPTYARARAGNVLTEGDAILHADAVRAQFGLDGTGVRVGVVSDGLKGVFATGCTTSCAGVDGGPIATGDLPTATGVRTAAGVLKESSGGIVGRSFSANGDLEGLPPASPACSFKGAGAEGTALLEIVHDLAPGAKLSFANGDTDLAFSQAVNFLAASNDVVLDDIGFFGEPYDGTSGVSSNTAAALNNPSWPIRAYATSAGNDADEHYYGAYVDSGVDGTTIAGITTPGHLHLFQRTADTTDVLGLGAQPFNVIALPQNGEAAIFLTWDDPFGGSSNNYDLYLVQQSTGKVVASSTDVQSGRQDPSEVIDYVNTGAADRFLIVVQNVRGAAQPRNLNIFSFEPECAAAGPALLAPPRHERHNYNTASRSISAQGDAGGSPVSVIAVGAICSASASAAGTFSAAAPDESCLDTSNAMPEFFSSRGPTLDGRLKPDILAIDGVSITGAGSFPVPFFGTSAAAPHVGGIAALLLQSAPCLLNRSTSTIGAVTARTTIRNLLVGKTFPLSAVPDDIVGAGRVDAFNAVQATLPTWNGTHTLTFDSNSTFGASLTAEQLGFVDPNACGFKSLTWTGGCGTAPGATMTCPAGANAVSVAASNNGITYSATIDFQINVTDFGMSLAPDNASVSAGQSSRHVVTVVPQGGAYNSEVTLSCSSGSLPPQTTCTFDPPTVIPHGAGAQSTLTISTVSTAAPASSAQARVRAGAITTQASGIAMFPSTVTFGSQTVNTTSLAQLVSITNTGADVLNITSITPSGDFATVSNCGTVVAAGKSCGVSVTFTPTAAGARTGSLTLVDDASGSPHTVTLNGTGQAAPSTTDGTPSGSYTLTISGTAGTSVAHSGTVTLTVK